MATHSTYKQCISCDDDTPCSAADNALDCTATRECGGMLSSSSGSSDSDSYEAWTQEVSARLHRALSKLEVAVP